MGTTYIKLNSMALKRVYKKESILWNAEYTINFETKIKDNKTGASITSVGNWGVSSNTAKYGDILVITENSNHTRTITCYKWDSPNDERWSNTITWPNNDAQYTYIDFNVSLTDSQTVENNLTITATCARNTNQYQIIWKYLEDYKDPAVASNLTSTTLILDYGTVLVMNGIKNWVANESDTARYKFEKWDKLADNPKVTGDLTLTAQYQHEGKLSVILTNCTQTSGAEHNTWHKYGTTCSIGVRANTNWAFDSTGTSTASRSVSVPGTLTVSPGYIYVTTTGNYCTPSVKTGWHAYGTQCTWDPATYYSFEGGATQKSSIEYLTTAGETYNKEPQYVRVERVDIGPYNYGVNINNSNYYLKDKKVQWTATSSYSYGGEVVNDLSSGTTIVPGGIMTAPNPDYVDCLISGTRCTPNETSGILAVGTNITYTTHSTYSFAEGIAGTTTSTKTVALGTTAYRESADYKFITISGTNCTADISTGYRKLGNIITWTGSTETNSKYSFSSTDKDAIITDTIVAEAGNYARKASYLWYNVTSATGTNCDAYTSTGYTTKFIPGWYIDGTTIYWKATGDAYAMTTSNATTLSENVKAGNNDKSAVVKQYTFTLTKNTNVSSIKVWRESSPYQGATIGSEAAPLLSSTTATTVYYGDVLKGKAIADTGYHFSNSNVNTSITFNSGSTTRDNYWRPIAIKNTYIVNLDLSALPSVTGITEQWLSLEQKESATHYAVGSTFNYNDTVYAIIKTQGSPTGIDTTASGWSLIYTNGQYNTYVVGSIKATGTASSLTITPQVVVNNYPVTITAGHGYNHVYLSTDPQATSGSSSGTAFPYESTVYGFAVLNVYTSVYPSGTLISGTAKTPGAIYRIGSKTVSASTTQFGEISLNTDSISVYFTGSGSNTGTVEFHTNGGPVSGSGYGSISKSESGNTITISCRTDNFNGDKETSAIATITYDSQYSASCILKNYAGTELAWNSDYYFNTNGILIEVELSPGGTVSS